MHPSKNCKKVRQASSKAHHATSEVISLSMNDDQPTRRPAQHALCLKPPGIARAALATPYNLPARTTSRQRRPVYEPAATRATTAFLPDRFRFQMASTISERRTSGYAVDPAIAVCAVRNAAFS